jgi:hypothetical protein
MGIKFDRILDAFDGPFEKIPDLVTPAAGKVAQAPGGGGYLLSHQVNDSFIAVNRLMKANEEVYWVKQPFSANGKQYPAGTMFIPAKASTLPIVQKVAADKGLSFDAIASRPAGEAMKLKPVRIGLYDQYGGSMPSGWVRWMFEQYEFPFELVFPKALDAGSLNSKYDVLVFVDGGIPTAPGAGGGRGGFGGGDAGDFGGGRGPDPQSIPAEYRDRLGSTSLATTIPQLRKFMDDGGTVLTIGAATSLGYHAGLPIRNALVERVAGFAERPLPNEKFYVPGSILEARIDTSNPLAYGMDERSMIYFDHSPAFRLQPEAALKGVKAVAWFDSPTPLRSGWAWGQQYLDQAVEVVEAPVGKGHLVLFGPEVAWRAQPHATFKLLFNGIYYGSATHRAVPGRQTSSTTATRKPQSTQPDWLRSAGSAQPGFSFRVTPCTPPAPSPPPSLQPASSVSARVLNRRLSPPRRRSSTP